MSVDQEVTLLPPPPPPRQVLQGHTKADVFEMVKDLNLPVDHGDTTLLKKLQALGLHSNRSDMSSKIQGVRKRDEGLTVKRFNVLLQPIGH